MGHRRPERRAACAVLRGAVARLSQGRSDGGLPAGAGTGPLVTALVAVTLLGERLSLTAVLGIAGVVAGCS